MGEKRDHNEHDTAGLYASPPCFMHELDPAYLGPTPEPDVQQCVDVMRWRKAERQRLIKERLAISLSERWSHTERIIAGLDEAVGDVFGRMVSVY